MKSQIKKWKDVLDNLEYLQFEKAGYFCGERSFFRPRLTTFDVLGPDERMRDLNHVRVVPLTFPQTLIQTLLFGLIMILRIGRV